MYRLNKFFFIRLNEIWSMDLAINLKGWPLAPSNIIYLCLHITAGAKQHQEEADIQKLQIKCTKVL